MLMLFIIAICFTYSIQDVPNILHLKWCEINLKISRSIYKNSYIEGGESYV